jgi:hypothetical protein
MTNQNVFFLDTVISFVISKSLVYKSYDSFMANFFNDKTISFSTNAPSRLLQLVR